MKYLGTKKLETDRLLLRKATMNDVPAAYQNWCSKDNVCKYVLWNKHNSVEETKKVYSKWMEDYKDDSTFRWIAELKATGETIGTINVSKKYISFGTCEISYCFGDAFWNQGYATEAVKKIVQYLFIECDAALIYAEFMENNPASGKVMEHIGMQKEARLRSRVIDKTGKRNDVITYSITKDEYLKRKM